VPTIGSIGVNIIVATKKFARDMTFVAKTIGKTGREMDQFSKKAQGLGDSLDQASTALLAFRGVGALAPVGGFAAGALFAGGAAAGKEQVSSLQKVRQAAVMTAAAVRAAPLEMQKADGVFARASANMIRGIKLIRSEGVGGLRTVRVAVQDAARHLETASNRASTFASLLGNTVGAGAGLERLVRFLGSLSAEMTFLSSTAGFLQATFAKLARGGLDLVFAADRVFRAFQNIGISLEAFGLTAGGLEGIIGKVARGFDSLFGKSGTLTMVMTQLDEVFAKLGVDFRGVETGAGGLAGILGRLETRMSALAGVAEGAAFAHTALSKAFAIKSPIEATTNLITNLSNRFSNFTLSLENAKAEYTAQIAVLQKFKESIFGVESEMTRWQKVAIGFVTKAIEIKAAIRAAALGLKTFEKSLVGKATVGVTRFAGRLVGADKALKLVRAGFIAVKDAAVGSVKVTAAVVGGMAKAVADAGRAVGSFASRWLTVSGVMDRSAAAIRFTATTLKDMRRATLAAATAVKTKLVGGVKQADLAIRRLSLTATAVLKPLRLLTRLVVPLLLFGAFAEATVGVERFNREIRNSAAIMKGAQSRMDELKEAAKRVATETRFSSVETAQGLRFLGQAGFDVSESIAALPIAAKFAQAAMDDMGESTDKLTDIMLAFQLPAGNAEEKMRSLSRVGDVLTAVQSETTTSSTQLADALGNKAAGAARIMGLSFEETAAILGVFAGVTVKGEKGGQQLTQILINLADNATKNKAAFEKMGIEVEDNTGRMRQFSGIVRDIVKSLDGLSVTQQFNQLQMLGFTKRSKGALLQVAGLSDEMDRLQKVAEGAGGKMDDVTKNQMTPFEKGWAKLRVAIMDFGEGAFGPTIDAIGRGMGKIAESMLLVSRTWTTAWELIGVQILIVKDVITKAFEAVPVFFGSVGMLMIDSMSATWAAIKNIGISTVLAVQAGWKTGLDEMISVLPAFIEAVKKAFESVGVVAGSAAINLASAFKAAFKGQDPRQAFLTAQKRTTLDIINASLAATRSFDEFKKKGEQTAVAIEDSATRAFKKSIDEGLVNELAAVQAKFALLSFDLFKGIEPDKALLDTFDELAKKLATLVDGFDAAAQLADAIKEDEAPAIPKGIDISGEEPGGVAALLKGSAEAFSATARAKRQQPIEQLNAEAKRQTGILRAQLDEQQRLRDGLIERPRITLELGVIGGGR